MAYPSRYYDMQRAVIQEIRFNQLTGLCPVCRKRKSGTWADGSKRITCGQMTCFLRWLPIHNQEEQDDDQATPQP